MRADSRRIRAARVFPTAATVAAVSWICACSGGETALGPAREPTNALASSPVQLLTVSNPVSVGGVAALQVASAGLAYVSFPPRTFPGVVSATISNPRTASTLTADVVDGGLDPIGIPAAAGDTLQVVTYASGGVTSPSLHAAVPVKALPIIVRTQPPWVRDSPKLLNLPSFLITLFVFSEPMDPASVNNNTVQLLQNGTPLIGKVALAADGLRATFETAAPLSPLTVYTLVLGPGITDLDGESLDQVMVSFTTSIAIAGSTIATESGSDPGPERVPGARWLLTTTLTSISGPTGVFCGRRPVDIGNSITWLMALQRSGQFISFDYDVRNWPTDDEQLVGTVIGNDFTAAMTQDITPLTGPCFPRLYGRFAASASGPFENASSLVGEEVWSYRLTSGEWVSLHFDWHAAPR